MSKHNLERVVALAAKDSKKGARVTAKVFYRMLRKGGFTENQIIDIATNILNCLTESLMGYEEKVEKARREKAATEMAKKSKLAHVPSKPKRRDHDAHA
jgi:hypothetical protein